MTDVDGLRTTVRVLELLDESYLAYARGDKDRSDLLSKEAARLDVDRVAIIHGGMFIGEIPRPDRDYHAWVEYLAEARAQLYDAEREASS